MSMGVDGCLRESMDKCLYVRVYECLWVCLWVSMGVYESLWGFIGIYGII